MLQRELAEHIHVSLRTIKAWENGYYAPSPDSINKLCDYFGISERTFFADNSVDTRLAQNSEKCRKCQYLWGNKETNTVLCDYFGRTGKLRGCPSGDECTKFEPRTVRRSYGKDFKI